MRLLFIAALICLMADPAAARHRRHRIHIHAPAFSRIVTVPVVSGQKITVASHLAPRWQALVADFVAAGYRPRRIGCYARGGHVPFSRHYSGAACDFDMRGWGLTVTFMYSATANALIRKHGFRNGCNFMDCGHVDDGLPGMRRYAPNQWLAGVFGPGRHAHAHRRHRHHVHHHHHRHRHHHHRHRHHR